MAEIQKIYTCECSTEAVSIAVDDEVPEVFITGWQMSPGASKMSLRERIRWCWWILRKGAPFNDHIILSFDTAKIMCLDILYLIADKGAK